LQVIEKGGSAKIGAKFKLTIIGASTVLLN